MSIFTNLVVTPLASQKGSMVGYGTVTISEVVDVKFTVVKGSNGIFASLPSQKGNKKDEKTGKDIWYPIVKITDNDSREEFQNLVKAAFLNQSEDVEDSTQPSNSGMPF